MSHPNREPKRAITIRIPQALYDKLQQESEAQDWALNDEINYRLRSAITNERIAKLESEITELKAMVKSLLEK